MNDNSNPASSERPVDAISSAEMQELKNVVKALEERRHQCTSQLLFLESRLHALSLHNQRMMQDMEDISSSLRKPVLGRGRDIGSGREPPVVVREEEKSTEEKNGDGDD